MNLSILLEMFNNLEVVKQNENEYYNKEEVDDLIFYFINFIKNNVEEY